MEIDSTLEIQNRKVRNCVTCEYFATAPITIIGIKGTVRVYTGHIDLKYADQDNPVSEMVKTKPKSNHDGINLLPNLLGLK